MLRENIEKSVKIIFKLYLNMSAALRRILGIVAGSSRPRWTAI